MRVAVDLSSAGIAAKVLAKVAKRSIPFAARNALNEAAFTTRRVWVEQMERNLTLRNTFTTRSLRVEKATGYDLSTMQAVVGSLVPYMAKQELGGTEQAKGKHGVSIPTPVASGQAPGAKRTKAVQPRNWLSALQLTKRVSGIRQRKNAVAIALAAKDSGVAFLDLGRRKGLFRVGMQGMGRGKRKQFGVRMIWDLTRKAVVTKRNPTLLPAFAAVGHSLPQMMTRAVDQQLKRALSGEGKRRKK